MNIMGRDETSFVGSNAIESLDFIRSSYLIPRGFLGPTLSFFTSHEEEKDLIASILPITFKLTEKRSIVITENNFDSMKTTIEPYLTSTERFLFNSTEHKEKFCKVFGIEYFDDISPALEAEIMPEINKNETVEMNLFNKLETIMNAIGNRSISKNKEKWASVIDDLVEEYSADAVYNVIQFLSAQSDDAIFWLKTITTPTKLIKHFEQIEQIVIVERSAIESKIHNDPEIQTRIALMRKHGESEASITDEVQKMVKEKIKSYAKKGK
ncbi:MAG: replication initiation protein, partial [Sulfuricurvum sp.]